MWPDPPLSSNEDQKVLEEKLVQTTVNELEAEEAIG